jgi:predicted permease
MTVETTRQDLRFAVRSLVARPAFSLVAVATIALGVGANTAIFSLVNAVVLRGVPGVEDTEGLVEINRSFDGGLMDVSYPVFREIRERADGLRGVAGFDLEPVSVGSTGDPQATLSASVTDGYFEVLGIAAGQGRFFAPAEATPPGSAPLAVITDHLWRTRLGADPGVVGSVIRVNGTPLTVIGVGPEGFRGHTRVPVDVFLPLGGGIQGLRSIEFLQGAQNSVIELIGRMEPGASTEAVAASVTTVADRLLEAETGSPAGSFEARVERWAPIPATGRGAITAFLAALMIVVGMVLVISCLNVAGMLLSRSIGRQGEFAVRRALGASRGRLVRLLLTESLVLFLAGGAAGVLLSVWLTRLLLALEPPLPPGFEITLDAALDLRVLAFASGMTILTAVLFNLLPALRATRVHISRDLSAFYRGGTPARGRARGALVGAQMAGSLLLLVVAGLFLRSLADARSFDTGWETDGVYSVALDLALIGSDPSVGRQQLVDILHRVEGQPGVVSAALAAKPPLAGRSVLGPVNATGAQPPEGLAGFEAAFNRVTDGYFSTLGIQLVAGRDFGSTDVEGGEPVAVVNERMAEVLWPGRTALGERFYIGEVGSERVFTVVGVVENTSVSEVGSAPESFYYLPFSQWYNPQMTLLVRQDPPGGGGLPEAIRAIIREAAPALPVQTVLPLRESLAAFFLPQRLAAWVSGTVGLVGLILAAVGVYGLTAVAVGGRIREIGLRLALGALPGEVRTRVLRDAMRAPLIGMAVGVTLAALFAQALSRFVGMVSPADPLAYAAAIAVLLGAALLAAFIPATRASRADPAGCLRAE